MVRTYGTSSIRVIELGDQGKNKNLNVRLHPKYPYLKSEVLFAVKEEMAQKPNDVLCRRVPLAFIDKGATEEVLTEVVKLMGS